MAIDKQKYITEQGEPLHVTHPEDVQRVLSAVRLMTESALEKLDYHEAFTSERYINAMRAIPLETRSKAVGHSLQYSILHPDGFMFWDFLDALKSIPFNAFGEMDPDKVSEYLLETIKRKLFLPEDESAEAKEKILRYCEKNIHENGCAFHGFNGSFEEEVREKGLTTTEREWDWSEMKKIHNICLRGGSPMALGWAFDNCENKLSFSTSPRETYSYAVNSPEWFGYFTSEGTHIPDENGRRQAFSTRNHPLARSNVEIFCDTLTSATDLEKQEILEFFEKYWEKFASKESGPRAAFIKNKAVNPELDWDNWSKTRVETRMTSLSSKSAREIVSLQLPNEVDEQCEHTIAREDIEIFKLPEYSQLFPE